MVKKFFKISMEKPFKEQRIFIHQYFGSGNWYGCRYTHPAVDTE